MNNITIEKASIQDIERLNDLYALLTGTKSSPTKMKDVFLTYMNNDDYCLLVAKSDGYVVATGIAIVYHSLANNCRPYFVIENVVVDLDYQRQGIGTLLFKKLHEYAINNNCCMAYLIAEANNLSACSFYQKMGYTDAVVGFQRTFKL